MMRPSWVEVDLAAVAHNVASFAALAAPAALCVVVKADGYGHGDVPVAEIAIESGATWLAVALAEEGIRLREAGIEAPILLLSEPDPGAAGELVRWQITPTVYSHSFLEALVVAVEAAHIDHPIDVHVKVDTGMHRVGADPDTAVTLCRRLGGLGLRLGGLWTHFADADADDEGEFTVEQIRRFDEVAAAVEPPLRHLANTAGTLLFPQARGDLVRVGLGIYGLYPSPRCRDVVDLRPAMRVVSHVSQLKRLPAASRPSYGRRRPLAAEATVATVPIGYADGFPRLLSQRGAQVLISGRRHPLAGTVTMDQIVVEVGDVPVAVGDEVVVLGRQGGEEISADEWAERTETISYEIVAGIGPRLPRRYRS